MPGHMWWLWTVAALLLPCLPWCFSEILSKGYGSNALGARGIMLCGTLDTFCIFLSRPVLLDFDGRCMMNMSNRQAVLVADSIFNRAGVGISEPLWSKPLASFSGDNWQSIQDHSGRGDAQTRDDSLLKRFCIYMYRIHVSTCIYKYYIVFTWSWDVVR